MGINYDQMQVHTRELIIPKLYSYFVQSKPILWWLMPGKASKDTLGDPQKGATWGGQGIGTSTMKMQSGSYEHSFRFQSDTPDAATIRENIDDATPVATKFADDLMKRAATRWTEIIAPMKIRQDRIEEAQGKTPDGTRLAIGSLIEEAVSMTTNLYLEKFASELWSGTMTEAEQDKEKWKTFLGLDHICSNTGFYAGKDRATYPMLQGNTVAAATLTTAGILTTDIINLSMFRQIKTVNTYGGMCNRYAKAGRLAITTPELWNKLANEAEGKHTIYDSGTKIPGIMSHISMEYPVIQKDTTLITYDPGCTSGKCMILTPDFFCFEVDPSNNFQVSKWIPKWKTEEGGGKYIWSNIYAKARLTCYRPDLQTQVTGLAVS
jgi:hypothetical protein